MGGRHPRTHHCTQHIHTAQPAATPDTAMSCDVTMETSNNTIVAYYQTLSGYKLQKYL